MIFFPTTFNLQTEYMVVLTESIVEKIVGFAADVTKRRRCWFISHDPVCPSDEILVRQKLNVT